MSNGVSHKRLFEIVRFSSCDTVQNRVDLKCCNSTRVACCEFICNRLHLSGTVLSLETVANIVILIQWCGEPGFDSDVLERGRYVLICSMISCPGETVRPSPKRKKRDNGMPRSVGLRMEGRSVLNC